MDLSGLESAEKMPVCEKTGTNIDLHLVAYKGLGSEKLTARILGADYRHLVRKTTTLSVPIWILSVGAIRVLEARKKIPAGTEAAVKLKAWLRYEVDSSWREIVEANQEALSLDDAGGLGF